MLTSPYATLTMMSFDTTPEAARVQADIIRSLGPEGRLRLACQMSVMVRELARARIRGVHADWTDRQILDALLLELYDFRLDP
jgi:hypothetical protein